MFKIEKAGNRHIEFWMSLDRHISPEQLKLKISLHECFIIISGKEPCGILRYGLFWDNTPFLNMIYIQEGFRGRGFGRRAVASWETEMLSEGYEMVMTSSLSDENAQHFYRKLGYRDAGCLFMPDEAAEIIFIKNL